ncbi:hypothetical protein AMTR_s00001p00272530, partial [Amborella trichopoda]
DKKGSSKRRLGSGVENKLGSTNLSNCPWAGKRQPGGLDHLSRQRKRKQKLPSVRSKTSIVLLVQPPPKASLVPGITKDG